MGPIQLGVWGSRLGDGKDDGRVTFDVFYGFMLYGGGILCYTQQKKVNSMAAILIKKLGALLIKQGAALLVKAPVSALHHA